jgi:hypothetical protein
MMIRRVVAQGFAPAMIIALGLLIAGVFVLMRLESKWGWILIVLAGFIGFSAAKHYGLI